MSIIKFHENINNLDRITCFSNEGNKWRNSNIRFEKKIFLKLEFQKSLLGKEEELIAHLKKLTVFGDG